ncbi:hypothetical protein N9D40_02115 [bacterium]|nr:hypothetical protein [Actinomycetota bacterium]MDA9870027.1 hypothetical protein [bacterium]
MDTRPGVFATEKSRSMELVGNMAVNLVLPLLARWSWPKFSAAFTQLGSGDLSPRLAGDGGWVLVVGAASIAQPMNPFITLLFSINWIVFVIAGAIAMVFCRTTQCEPLLLSSRSSQKVVSGL